MMCRMILAAAMAATAAATASAGRMNLDADWEYALKDDFKVSFRKVGMGSGGNNNGIPLVEETKGVQLR